MGAGSDSQSSFLLRAMVIGASLIIILLAE
jgi:hypothetical protein